MSSSGDILVCCADSLIGTWLVRELIRHTPSTGGPNEAATVPRIYATVFSARNRRSHELFTLGADVIEISESNQSRIDDIVRKVQGIVVIPPLENRPEWDKEAERCIDHIAKSNPKIVIYLSSVYGGDKGSQGIHATDYERGKEILDKLSKVEKKFEEVGKSKSWAVLRTTFMQEFLLHYSRLIQETGTLLVSKSIILKGVTSDNTRC
jgi:hypothetical protein